MTKEKVNPHHFNDDILGGIKSAIERGEELKDAMMTFYNAGYSKREIEEAARNYVMEKRQRESNLKSPTRVSNLAQTKEKKQEKTKKLDKGKQQDLSLIQPTKEQSKPASASENPVKKVLERVSGKQIKSPKQIVSNYGKKPVKKKHTFEPITIVLVLLLVFLILILGAVFLFKEELVTFFNNLFG